MGTGDSSMSTGGDSAAVTTPDGGSLAGNDGNQPDASSTIQVTSLLCEYLKDPLGIDTTAPRLSWALESAERGQKQTAYQIVVSGDAGDLWDTGKVVSAQQAHVVYAGKALVSGQRVTWKVRVWDAHDQLSAFSAPASWEMALLRPEDWKGKWIARTDTLVTPPAPAPYMRRAFMTSKPVRSARAYIAGVGYSELYLNGKKISDHVLDPGFTRYDRRILYVTHDVTASLQTGNNVIGVVLGNGFLNQHAPDAWNFETAPWRVTPRLLLELHLTYDDGTTETLTSDETWKVSSGPIVFDGIRNGESYDARLERADWAAATYKEDASWTAPLVVKSPGGVLSAQMFPPQKVMQTLDPVKVTLATPGVFVFDFGQNAAGWSQLSMSGAAGTKITLRYGEKLATNGTVDQSGINQFVKAGAFQTDTYTLKGQGTETWEPRFVYHGFRYVEMSGFPGTPTAANLKARVVHTSFENAGTFSSSNDLFNKIQTAILWSYRSNFQSIPTDCPQREKNGWMADAHISAELAMFNFANAAGYTKWMRDLRDEMKPTGEMPGIVPTGGWGYAWGNGPAWDSAVLVIPWYLYEYYGDEKILTDGYDYFKRYVDYVGTRNYLTANPAGWLGDWVPAKDVTPEAVTHAGYHASDARITAATARLLGKMDEATKYDGVAAQVKRDFLAKFFTASSAQVAGDTQTALATALYQGLLDDVDRPRVMDRLLAKITERNDHLDTGVLGIKYLPWVLTDSGHADVFFKIANQKDFPSWGYMLAQGATTLWEDWAGKEGSKNHIFLGDISAWFYRGLAGINPDITGPGFAKINIRPEVVGDLTWAKAETRTLRGLVQSEWHLETGDLVLTIAIPVNSTATVYVPAKNKDNITADGATFVRTEAGRQVYSVESGKYTFTAKGGPNAP
jgi:alpha-L-rhamnosidase